MLMLNAFALENFLKGHIVRTQREHLEHEVQRTHTLPEVLRGHDLVALAKRVGFEPTFGEAELLRRLDRSSTWAGRYPCPLRPEDISMEQFSNGTYRLTDYLSSYDFKQLS